jgi:hypothetical protein
MWTLAAASANPACANCWRTRPAILTLWPSPDGGFRRFAAGVRCGLLHQAKHAVGMVRRHRIGSEGSRRHAASPIRLCMPAEGELSGIGGNCCKRLAGPGFFARLMAWPVLAPSPLGHPGLKLRPPKKHHGSLRSRGVRLCSMTAIGKRQSVRIKIGKRFLRVSLAVLLLVVVWVYMAMGLILANRDPLFASHAWGELTCVGWPFIYVSGFGPFARRLSSGQFDAGWLLANVVVATTLSIASATVLWACWRQRAATWQFSLSDVFISVTAAAFLAFLVLWDRNLASLDFRRNFPHIGEYCPLNRYPAYIQIPIWITIYCVVVAAIRIPRSMLIWAARHQSSR